MTRTLRAANAALAVIDGELLDVIIQQNWQGQIAPAIAVLGDMAEDDADTYDVSARISWVGWVSTWRSTGKSNASDCSPLGVPCAKIVAGNLIS